MCALTTEGKVRCWGSGDVGPLATIASQISLLAHFLHQTLAFTSATVIKIDLGVDHGCAVSTGLFAVGGVVPMVHSVQMPRLTWVITLERSRLLQILMWEPRSLMLVLLITIPVLSQQTTEVGAGVTMGKASWDEITPLMWVMETALLIIWRASATSPSVPMIPR